jgi:hypothetical protein
VGTIVVVLAFEENPSPCLDAVKSKLVHLLSKDGQMQNVLPLFSGLFCLLTGYIKSLCNRHELISFVLHKAHDMSINGMFHYGDKSNFDSA